MLSVLNSDQYMAECNSGLLAQLTHAIPILDELPTATVVRIRNEEPDSFLRYRVALSKILTEYIKARKHVEPSEAKQIYADLLLPEILRLRSETKNYRKAKMAGAIKKGASSAIAVTLGLFGGFSPEVTAALIAAGVTGLLDVVSENQKAKSEIRNENFYFLLKILDESEIDWKE